MSIGRLTGVALSLALLLAPGAGGAAGKGKKAKAAPAAVLAPVKLAAPTLPASLTPVKRSDLQELAKKKATERYADSQAKFLARYDIAGDRREAFAVDHSLYVTPAPRMEQYLQLLAGELLQCWSGARPPIRILVVARADPWLRAYGSGVIEVSTGTIKSVQSTDVLAFMLAHEIAHILKQDEARRNEMVETLLTLVNVGSSGAIYANEVVFQKGGNGPKITFRREFGSGGVLVAGFAGDALLQDVFRQLMGAKQEFAADRIALDLVACARRDPDSGYNNGMALLHQSERVPLDKVKKAAALAAVYVAKELFAEKAGDNDLIRIGKALGLAGTVASTGKLADMFEKAVNDKLSPQMRVKEIDEYATKTYRGIVDLPDPEDREFNVLRAERPWTELVALVDGNEALQRMLLDAAIPNDAGAMPAVTYATFAPAAAGFRTDPRIADSYRVAAVVAQLRGDAKGAGRTVATGADMPWATREHLLTAGKIQARAGDAAALSRTIAHGQARMGSVPELLPLQVWRAALLQQPAQLEKLAAECLSKGGLPLYAQCTGPLGYDPMCAPRTPEGKAALEGAALTQKVKTGFSVSGMISAAVGGRKDATTRCAETQSGTGIKMAMR